MNQPDISNAAQQAQERASAIDMKRAALEFDQARPRVGPDGWAEIDEEERARPAPKSDDVTDHTGAVEIHNTSRPKSLTLVPESRLSRLK